MLKKIRIVLAALFFAMITLLLLDITGALHLWFGWMAKIQLLPAFLALNLAVVILMAVITFVFGRIYCSVICPLGVMQDIISWASGKRKGKKLRFGFKKENKWLRYGVLALFIILMVAGINSIAILIAPYSAYGRIVTNLLGPLYGWGNNLLAAIAEHFDSYAFYETEVYIKSLPTFIVAVVTFAVIFTLAWKGGRTWCNNICPVGTVLGLISRFSLFRPTINLDKCINCGKCGKKCKASCIDTKNHRIDYSRCVVCMDCLENCSTHAISYTLHRNSKQSEKVQQENCHADSSRRNFLTAGLMLATAATVEAQEKKMDGGLAALEKKKVPVREVVPSPAGSGSIRHFTQHCTACQLCVAECPSKVLRPSTDFDRFMQPEMSFEKGFCRTGCTRCSQVCPAGAIKPITAQERTAVSIGFAVWIPDNCVVNTDGVSCGHCAAYCPAGAIKMVKKEDNDHLRIPAVDTEKCIGCGACENLCPARPLSAIYIEGRKIHTEI